MASPVSHHQRAILFSWRQDLQSYSRALDACSGARRWEEALGLVQDVAMWRCGGWEPLRGPKSLICYDIIYIIYTYIIAMVKPWPIEIYRWFTY